MQISQFSQVQLCIWKCRSLCHIKMQLKCGIEIHTCDLFLGHQLYFRVCTKRFFIVLMRALIKWGTWFKDIPRSKPRYPPNSANSSNPWYVKLTFEYLMNFLNLMINCPAQRHVSNLEDLEKLTVCAAKPGSLWVLDSQLETEIHSLSDSPPSDVSRYHNWFAEYPINKTSWFFIP